MTSYIGMGERIDRTHAGVRRQIESIDAARLREVLDDLRPTPGAKPILNDSRDVTLYSDVLNNDRAREAMRDFHSLSLAVEIASRAELADRLKEMTRSIEVLTVDIKRYEIGDPEVLAADEFLSAARILRGAVAASKLGADE